MNPLKAGELSESDDKDCEIIDDSGNISAAGVAISGLISGSGELTVKNNIVTQGSLNVSGNAVEIKFIQTYLPNGNAKSKGILSLIDANKLGMKYSNESSGKWKVKGDTIISTLKRSKTKNISMIDRSSEHNIAYTGWQIVNPKPIIKINKKIFSLNLCYNEAIKNKLLWGVLNKGKWLHIGTKKSLIESEKWIKNYKL